MDCEHQKKGSSPSPPPRTTQVRLSGPGINGATSHVLPLSEAFLAALQEKNSSFPMGIDLFPGRRRQYPARPAENDAHRGDFMSYVAIKGGTEAIRARDELRPAAAIGDIRRGHPSQWRRPARGVLVGPPNGLSDQVDTANLLSGRHPLILLAEPLSIRPLIKTGNRGRPAEGPRVGRHRSFPHGSNRGQARYFCADQD